MSKVTKKQLQEDIKSLESGITMNWSDMKKIEVRLSRAMTDMATRISNISLQLEGQQRQIRLAADSIGLNKQAIIMLENKAEPKPQLKQLDQSVFNGLDEKRRFAAVDSDGVASYYDGIPEIRKDHFIYLDAPNGAGQSYRLSGTYDASNWQNSLIERKAELKGSDLCRAMLARGDKYVLCGVSDNHDSDAADHEGDDFLAEAVTDFDCKDELFGTTSMRWNYAVPINNMGEPLTAKEVGL